MLHLAYLKVLPSLHTRGASLSHHAALSSMSQLTNSFLLAVVVPVAMRGGAGR
jgi:hypothetical protein